MSETQLIFGKDEKTYSHCYGEECPDGYSHVVSETNECVSTCPDEFPVYDEADKVCKTCADATGGEKPFWLGGSTHTTDSCSDRCPSMFYKVVGSSYQCVSKCEEHQFGEFDDVTWQIRCVNECAEESFADSQASVSG